MLNLIFIRFFYALGDHVHDLLSELKSWRQAYFFRRPLMIFLALYAGITVWMKTPSGAPSLTSPHKEQGTKGYGRITGVVVDQPDSRLRGMAYEMDRDDKAGKIMVEVINGTVDFAAPGDRISVYGKPIEPQTARIPNTFDYKDYLSHKNIHTIMYVGSSHIENFGDTHKHPFQRWGWNAHQFIDHIFETTLDSPSAAVLAGLVVGDRPHRHPDIKQMFLRTGTMHILVASGSNIAFVVAMWFLLMRLLFRMPRRWALLTTLPCVWLYSLMVGMDAPIVRSAFMASIAILYYWFQKEDQPYYMLTLAALGLLLINSGTLFDTGFQMSFITVFGLIFWLHKLTPMYRGFPRWLGRLIPLVTATFCAEIWLWPIMVNVFKKIYPWGFIGNMIILPLSMAGLFVGLALIFFYEIKILIPFITPLCNSGIYLIQLYLHAFIRIVAWLSQHIGTTLWLAPWSTMSVIGFYTACLCVGWVRQSRLARWGLTLGILLVFAGFRHHPFLQNTSPDLRFTWLDMGRRLSIVIEQKNKPTILINPPSEEAAEKLLYPYTAEKGIHCNEKWTIKKNGYLIFSSENTVVVMSDFLSLRLQREILMKGFDHIDILQTRFAKKLLWDQFFIKKYHPTYVVETGYNSEKNPSCPPWKESTLIVPQQSGVWVWEKPKSLKKIVP